jgi:hypothetical protein
MENLYWINSDIDGQRRWHLVFDKQPGLYFVKEGFEEEAYDIEEYKKDFPDNEVVEVPNVYQVKNPLGICDDHKNMWSRVDCPLCDFLFVYDRLNLAVSLIEDCLKELSDLPDIESQDPDGDDEVSRGRVCKKLEAFLGYMKVGLEGPCMCDEVGEGRCPKHGLENLADDLRRYQNGKDA